MLQHDRKWCNEPQGYTGHGIIKYDTTQDKKQDNKIQEAKIQFLSA